MDDKLLCWWCDKPFLKLHAKKPREDMYECPYCQGWTGYIPPNDRQLGFQALHIFDPGRTFKP